MAHAPTSRAWQAGGVALGTGRREAVLFDVFGTLVDYQPDRSRLTYPSTCDLLRRWGHEMSPESFVAEWDAASTALEHASSRTLEEFTMFDAATSFADATGLPLSPAQCHELAATFLDEWQAHVVPIAGVADLLTRLAPRFRIGIVSNTHDPGMVPSILGGMGVADHLDMVLLSVDHGHRKPHPSIYRAAIDLLGSPASEISFVGDSFEADYLGPTRAGMTAYLVDPTSAHDLPARNRLDSILDLEARLDSPPASHSL